MKGIIIDINPIIVKQRLKIKARIETQEEGVIQAFCPDREVAALLPKNVLLGRTNTAAPVLLETIGIIIKRMACGRHVRTWQYRDQYYFSFSSWKNVKFSLAA